MIVMLFSAFHVSSIWCPKHIAVITYYRVNLEAVIIDFLSGFISDIRYATKDLDAIVADGLTNWNWEAVNN